MANIVLAWELGSGKGHLVTLRALAGEFRARGHRCIFALSQIDAAESLQLHELGDVLQAPSSASSLPEPDNIQVSYASLLHVTGFHDPLALVARLRAWRRLLNSERADLLVAEHAPVALAAARGLMLPAAVVGTGFTVPPLLTPFPLFRIEPSATPELLAHNEAQVLLALNLALERLKQTPLASLQDLFSQTQRGLFTYVETDHYNAARTEPYLGLPDFTHGDAPLWPEGSGPLIFGYLRPYKHLEPLVRALAAMPARVLLHIAQFDIRKLAPILRTGMHLTNRPVNIRQAAAQCNFFVHYAAHNTTCEMLLAGKPGLLLPHHQEQQLMAQKAMTLGAALAPPPVQERYNLSEALRRLSEDQTLHRSAESFAARYRDQVRENIMPNFVEATLERFNIPVRAAPADS